jgi:hypothetical protein
MKNPYTTPVPWAEQIVGTPSRFWTTVGCQVGAVLLFCYLSEWHHVGPLLLFGLVTPLHYLFALRGVVRELHNKPEFHERPAAA